MKKMNLAVSVLLALGVAACGGSDGDSTPTTASTATTTTSTGSTTSTSTTATTGTTSSTTGTSTTATTGTTSSTTGTSTTATTGTTSSTTGTSTTATTGTTGSTTGTSTTATTGTTGSTTGTSTTATYAKGSTTGAFLAERLATDESYKALVAEAKAAEEFYAVCSNSNGKLKTQGCGSNVPPGTVIRAYEGSYAGYGALREVYGSSDTRTAPVNSFFYYVDTPTTNKTAVIDATYKGQVSYSYNYLPAIQTRGVNVKTLTIPHTSKFYMTVENGSISGKVTETNGKGVPSEVMTFNSAAIGVRDDSTIGFNGTVTFHTGNFGDNNTEDFAGTYSGAFAGTNAEEVVGTFESNSNSKEQSVQGAFYGAK